MPPEGPVTVVLATDSFLIGDGLAALLEDVEEVKIVGRARNHEEVLDVVDRLEPEAVIISIRTPMVATMSTIRKARQLRINHPELGIVVIADRGNGYALAIVQRIYATGLDLEGILQVTEDPVARARLQQLTAELDGAVAEISTTGFANRRE